MMAVGNDQLLVAHLLLDGGNDAGIRNLPDPVRDRVFVGDIDRGDGVWLGSEQGIDLSGIFVKQEELLVMRTGGSKQVEPVGLRLGQRLLVPEDNLGGVIFHTSECDESPALKLASGRGRKGLRIGVKGGRRIRSEDSFGSP